MWDRYSHPEEMVRFMQHVAREIDSLRADVHMLMREVRNGQLVRERLERERPGYWDDSVKLGHVCREFEKAR